VQVLLLAAVVSAFLVHAAQYARFGRRLPFVAAMSRPRTVVIALCSALVALAVGLWLGGHPGDLPDPIRDAFVDDDPALRAEVIDTIEDNYYREVPNLEERSLKAIVRSLHDPFSHYLTPKEAKAFQASVEGRFEGVGMTVKQDRRGLEVLSVFDGSPARRAGIRKGDLITAVNGRSIAGLNSEVATGRIKGKAGTKVTLTVVDPPSKRERTVKVERQRIDVPVAEGRVVERGGTRLGVVRLVSFSSGAHGVLRQQIDRVLDRGAKGLVLDLRGNGGGLLREAVLVSSIFIEDGKIVSVRGRARPQRTEDAVGGAIDPKIPVVVLVDGGSASASEITTGALRDRHRATVVGTHTFGKGLVQEVEPLSNGGILDITVANYYLPDGETIAPRKGITPQVRARDDPDTDRDEALPVALDALLKQTR
jgi:carboxyl-terminal processing protease